MNSLYSLLMSQPDIRPRHPMDRQRFGGPFGQPTGGYDSSGINPHGMYTGGFHPQMQVGMQQLPPQQFGQQPQRQPFPANPGEFSALGGLFGRY